MEDTLRKIARNSIIVLSGNIGANLFGLLSTTIITRTMGAEIFGYYALIQVFLVVADRLFGFQTWQVFIKFATDFEIKGEERNLKMLLKSCFLIDCTSLGIGFVVLALSGNALAAFFNLPGQYSHLVAVMATLLLFRIFEVSTGVFRIFDAFAIPSRILVYSAMAKAALFALAAAFMPTLASFVYATVASQALMFVLKVAFVRSLLAKHGMSFREIAAEPINRAVLKEHKVVSFLFFTNFDVSVRMISRQLDILLLGKLATADIVGVFKIAKEVAGLIGQLTDPIYNAIYPELARLLSARRNKEAYKVAGRIAFFAGLGGIAFFVAFLLFGKFGIRLAFGAAFESAYGLICIYYAAVFMAIISLPVAPMIFAFGLARQAFVNQVIANAAYVAAAIPLIYYYSANGAAAAYSVFYVFWLGLSLRTLRNRMEAGASNVTPVPSMGGG